MRWSILKSIALCVGILLCVALSLAGADKKGKEGKVIGTVCSGESPSDSKP